MVVGSGAAGRARRGEHERGFFSLALDMFSRDKRAREGLEELTRRLEQLEHNYKLLKLEWEEAYEKIANTLRKLGRRAEVLQKEMDGGKPPLSPEEQALADNMSDQTAEPRGLATRQLTAKQLVMRRRGGVM